MALSVVTKGIVKRVLLGVYLLLLTLFLLMLSQGISSVFTTIFIYVGIIMLGVWLANKLVPDQKNIKFTFVLVMLVLLSGEMFFRFVLQTNLSYSERNGSLFYSSPFSAAPPKDSWYSAVGFSDNWALRHKPLSTHSRSKTEFTSEHQYNELGYRDAPLASFRDTGSFKILGIGDSFTEGVGTPPDSTWLKGLEKSLGMGHVKTMNAGCSGSDVFYYRRVIEYVQTEVPVDLVVVAINSSDVDDYLIRGGAERFGSDGVQYRTGPWWESLYAVSYIFRSVRGLLYKDAYLFKTPDQLEQERSRAMEDICKEIEQGIVGLATDHELKLVVVFHPNEQEVISDENPFAGCLNRLPDNDGVMYIDLFPVFQKLPVDSLDQYIWPIDKHYTPKGYILMGRVIADSLQVHQAEFLSR